LAARSLLIVAASAFGLMIGVIAAAGSVLYLVPSKACDSGCWTNDTLMRVLGVAGIPLAVATASAVPVAVWLARTRPRVAAFAFIGIAVSMVGWWILTQRLLDSAVAT